tara:strand:+ start:191 stop:658 length:468 start_codon:yes stop_codon:yes gene_type:complete
MSKEILFEQLKHDISQNPPNLKNITVLLTQFVEGFCKFCPSKNDFNNSIRNRFPSVIKIEDTLSIIKELILTIEKFQSPNDDIVTKKMLNNVINNYNNDSIIIFLSEFYDHVEKVYKDVWDCRKRLVNGENIIPENYRKKIDGKNNIPNKMKTGR